MIIAGVAIAAAAGALLAAWQISRPAELPQASCGQTVTHDLDASTQILSADPRALQCFDSAARACTPASIEITQMGVDAGTRYVLTIGSGGTACQVTGLSQDYGGPDWKGPVRTVPFRLAAVTGQGVMLRCGGQDVLIPAAMSVRWGGTGSTVAQPNVSVVTATEPRCRSIRRGRAAVLRLLPWPGQRETRGKLCRIIAS